MSGRRCVRTQRTVFAVQFVATRQGAASWRPFPGRAADGFPGRQDEAAIRRRGDGCRTLSQEPRWTGRVRSVAGRLRKSAQIAGHERGRDAMATNGTEGAKGMRGAMMKVRSMSVLGMLLSAAALARSRRAVRQPTAGRSPRARRRWPSPPRPPANAAGSRWIRRLVASTRSKWRVKPPRRRDAGIRRHFPIDRVRVIFVHFLLLTVFYPGSSHDE